MCEKIVPVDLLAEIWRLDWRLNLRLLQCGREEEGELNGESDRGVSWSPIYRRSKNPRGVVVKSKEIRIFD